MSNVTLIQTECLGSSVYIFVLITDYLTCILLDRVSLY